MHGVDWHTDCLSRGMQPASLLLQVSYKRSKIQKLHSQEVFPGHVSGIHCYPDQLVQHLTLLAAGELSEVNRLRPCIKKAEFQVKMCNCRA